MMLNELALWPIKLHEGAQLAQGFGQQYANFLASHRQINKIAFVGMGGSGIAGRIVKTFLDNKSTIPSFIIEGTSLPAYVDSHTLVFVASYSGNTWETIDVLEQLTQKFIPTVAISHGGRVAEMAELKGLPFILLPDSLTPRSSLGHTMGFLLGVFDAMGILPGFATIDAWRKEAATYIPSFQEASFFNDFLTLAQDASLFHLWGVAGDSAAAAYRSCTQFNENSKIQAVYNTFPELAHNLLVGFDNNHQSPLAVLFHTDFLPAHMSIGIQAISEILKEKRVVLYKPPVFGNTFESQVFNMILWSDFASCHLGRLRGAPLESVQIIDELKKRQKLNGIK